MWQFCNFSEAPTGSKSDSWVPINSVAPASETGLSTSSSDSALGAVKDEVKTESKVKKTESQPVNTSPQKDSTTQVKSLNN